MKKVLVVDDDPVNRMVLEELLDDGPYGVEMAASGEEALELCEQFRPDVILLDIMMPGIDGYETCARLRKDDSQRLTKVMFVSAKASVSNKRQAYEVGGDDYISKPFDHDELLARIQTLAGLKSIEQAECLPTEFLELLSRELRTEVLGSGEHLAESGPITDVAPEEVVARCDEYSVPLECLEEICKLKGGLEDPATASIDLVELTLSAIGELRGQAQDKGIEIRSRFPASAQVHAEVKKLGYVVRALLKNAIDVGPRNVPVVAEIRNGDGALILSVTGKGADADCAQRVFDEFSRENWRLDEKRPGLSLAFCRVIVEHFGGTIEAQSVSGPATRFKVRLKSAP